MIKTDGQENNLSQQSDRITKMTQTRGAQTRESVFSASLDEARRSFGCLKPSRKKAHTNKTGLAPHTTGAPLRLLSFKT